MQLNTVIFDMDGLLINSEPLWHEAGNEVLKQYGITLTDEQYQTTTGLRTKEFVEWCFFTFNIGVQELMQTEQKIIEVVMDKIANNPGLMPGVQTLFDMFYDKKFKIGIASSSPVELIELVMDICGLRKYVTQYTSAQHLKYAKPHPEVYLVCAEMLQSSPLECVCFEDSFYGMIAVKAARMKCVVVPEKSQQQQERWGAADLRLASLEHFEESHLNII